MFLTDEGKTPKYIPINQTISVTDKLIDLSDFMVSTTMWVDCIENPFDVNKLKIFYHDGNEGLINRECLDSDEEQLCIYAMCDKSFIIVTKRNILFISFAKRNNKSLTIERLRNEEFPSVYIEQISDHIINQELKKRVLKIKDADRLYGDHYRLMEKISTLPFNKKSFVSVNKTYNVTDRLIDCSNFIILSFRQAKGIMRLQLHDGVNGLVTLETTDGKPTYSFDDINNVFIRINNQSSDISKFDATIISLIDKRNNFFLNTGQVLDVTKDGNPGVMDINKLKIYFVVYMNLISCSSIPLWNYVSCPINKITPYIVDPEIKELALSMNDITI